MNKSVITSVSPRECELIARGRQTMLVRKTRPKIETPFKDYIYCSKGKMFLYKNPNNGELFLDSNGGYRGGDYEDRFVTQKIIGSFVCDRIVELKINGDDCGNYWHEWNDECDIEDMCLSYEELETYLGKFVGYGWHISDLKIYDKPKELYDFRPWCEKSRKTDDNLEMCCNCKNAFFDDDGAFFDCGLTTAPKTWCYIEEE